MQGILNWLAGLGNLILSLVNFVFGMIADLLYVISLLANLVIRLPDILGWIPSACLTLVVTTFSIVVIYKVLGREG